MMHFRKIIIFALGAILLTNVLFTNTSCLKNKELYDSALVDTLIKWSTPVSRIDSFHTWHLTTNTTVTVTANADVEPVKVQILTDNPRASGGAKVITQAAIAAGKSIKLGLSYPSVYTTLYAALVDSADNYTVASFNPTSQKANFLRPLFVNEKIAYKPEPVSYAYCFETEFPEPGDHDFNDIVLDISMERIAERQLQLNVKLAAVGTNYQTAACIRLANFDYDDIDSVYSVGGIDFNYKFPDQVGTVLGHQGELLIKGRNNEAVINLFEDAHWATGDFLEENHGVFARNYYNVHKGSHGGSQLMIVPRTVSFVITFKDGLYLDEYTMDQLDPFAVKGYGGGSWEIHQKEYAYAQTLFTYTSNQVKYLPWVLKIPSNTIPSGSFRHPIEGQNIGFYVLTKDSTEALFGAYSRRNHAFGVWASDQTQAIDWYLYPNEGQVY